MTLITALVFCLGSTFTQADEQADRQKLEEIKSSIAQLKAELEEARGSRAELQQTLEQSEKDISELNKKSEQLKRELNERQQTLEDLRSERRQLNQQKHTQQAQVSQHINAAYRLGQQTSLRLLLNQQDPTTVARNIKYFNYVITARTDKISDFTHTIERINRIEPEIAYQTTLLDQSHQKLNAQRQQLQAAQKKRQATLASINSKLSSGDLKLRNMYQDRQRLEKLMNQVSEWLKDIKVPQSDRRFANLKGQLPWPTNGKILKHFGNSRVANKITWQGMLIGARSGTPVMAVHHGRIVFSDYLRGHGLLIIIDHGDGYMSLYAHNQALYKELGDWVDGGETIASVGNSGGQFESALYFELRYKGHPTNPKRWFRPA